MAKKNRNVDPQNPLSSIPSYVKTPEGIFEDIEHYRAAAERITKALAKQQKRSSKFGSSSSLFDGIEIEFSSKYKSEEIYLDNLGSKIILRAPKRKGETEATLSARRMFYFEHLIRPAEAMRTIGISYIYLSLKEEGRRKISQRSKKHRGQS